MVYHLLLVSIHKLDHFFFDSYIFICPQKHRLQPDDGVMKY